MDVVGLTLMLADSWFIKEVWVQVDQSNIVLYNVLRTEPRHGQHYYIYICYIERSMSYECTWRVLMRSPKVAKTNLIKKMKFASGLLDD
jgi:hypothetical protein